MTERGQKIRSGIAASIALKQELLADEVLLREVEGIVEACVRCFQSGGKLLLCGNGGSAADAQHLAAELSGRYYRDRPPLFAEALHVNSSYLTAVANDYGYDQVFARLVNAMGRRGDLLFAFSTSGNSPNVLQAISAAHKQDMQVVGFTGREGGRMKGRCDWLLRMPSSDTPRVQEGHLLLGHLVCQLIEEELFV
jgi:D-sedoheptulose 7-phosphate isomerase